MKLEKIFLNKENLIKISEIDKEFYKDDTLNIEWYLERYNDKHYAYCLIDNDNIVGYIVSVPVKKELYDAIINGVLVNDFQINPDMFINESNYHYIISYLLKEEYRYKKYGHILLKAALKDLEDKQACCLTITKAGYSLASKYMKLEKKLNEEIAVFKN